MGNTGDLIFRGQGLQGFWLPRYLQGKGMVGKVLWARRVGAMLLGALATDVACTVPMEGVPAATLAYIADMSAGKVLIDLRGP